MVHKRAAIRRNAVDFGLLFALVIGGSVLVTSVPRAVDPPTSGYLQGLVLVGLSCVGLGWLLWRIDDEQRLTSLVAGLGGSVGAIAATTFLEGSLQQAAGAGLGALVFSVGAILWTRVLSS